MINYIVWLISIFLLFNSCSTLKKTSRSSKYGNDEQLIPERDTSTIKKIIVLPADSAVIKLATKNKLLLDKYARELAVSPDSLNIRLYGFIDEWMGVPYLWGGTDKHGIDCSAFIRRIFMEVYGLQLPRTSLEQVLSRKVERFTATKFLAEGDILFFRTIDDKLVSHVGFYLRNHKFINSSSSKGVVMYSLLDDYWKSRFVVAARVRSTSVRRNVK